LNGSATGSLKSRTINDADGKIISCVFPLVEIFFLDNFSFRIDDTLTRSLKIKLKQRRDKIEQSESVNRIVL
jgi:hypothetical protein